MDLREKRRRSVVSQNSAHVDRSPPIGTGTRADGPCVGHQHAGGVQEAVLGGDEERFFHVRL